MEQLVRLESKARLVLELREPRELGHKEQRESLVSTEQLELRALLVGKVPQVLPESLEVKVRRGQPELLALMVLQELLA
jgi:hypothetical protein